MIAKINELKRTTTVADVKSLCETTIAAMSSAIYNGVTPEARFEIERVATENLFEGLSKYPDDKLITEWLINEQRLYSVKNIGVRKAINKLKEVEAKNDPTLAAMLEKFQEKVEQYPEALIYEEFVSALAGEYNWVPGVTTQLDALSNRISKYKNDIDITKIIETMKVTRSNYLLPLIEDVVNNYIKNKTAQTKSHLKETLVKFSYDPFVRDLINLVMVDATDLQLEYANAQCDVEKVYSPLMYLGENEVAFNVKGTFYIKKGNNINKLKKDEVEKLDENFRALCEAVNVPNVEFDRKAITVYVGNNKAVITEDTVEVNTHVMNEQEFKDAAEVSQWTGETNFFMLTEVLRTNFNEIAPVDFAKRVYLKEDEGHAADILKLRNNIFITTYDPANNKSTFYRNINPIQAEKVMMEHMNFDVSKTFADILPNKEKILTSIEESKKEFTEYIQNLNEKIDLFKSQTETETTAEVLEALEEELREVKSEFKDYVNEMETYTNVVAENITVSIDVDGEKYTVPIPQSTSTAKGEVADNEPGTIVGAENMEPSPASEITFDDDQTELLGDAPSIKDDEVDLGVDNVEAEADAAEAEADASGEEEVEAGEDVELDAAEEGGEDLEDEGGEEDLGDLEDSDEEDTLENDDENAPEFTKKTALLDDTTDEEAPEELEVGDLEGEAEEVVADVETESGEEEIEDLEGDDAIADDTELEVSDEESGEGDAEVEDVEVVEKPKDAPKVFLKKTKVLEHHKKGKAAQIAFICKNDKKCKKEDIEKLSDKEVEKKYLALEKKMGINESVKGKKKVSVNECVQIGDDVMLNKEKGSVIGEVEGDLIVQVQGNTFQVKPSEVTLYGEKPEEIVKPPYEFDKDGQNLTTKKMFEQYVKCGIYERNAAIKLNNCFVKFNEYNKAADTELIPILIESRTALMPKSSIRLLENPRVIEEFAPAAVIDAQSGEVVENVEVCVEELMAAVGAASNVTILRTDSITGEQTQDSVPSSLIRPVG